MDVDDLTCQHCRAPSGCGHVNALAVGAMDLAAFFQLPILTTSGRMADLLKDLLVEGGYQWLRTRIWIYQPRCGTQDVFMKPEDKFKD